MAHKKSIQSLCDRELLEKILGLVESQKMSPAQNRATQTHRVYDNKTLMETLRINYWYTQQDVDRFLRRFHYEEIASDLMLPEQQGGGYV